MADCRTCWLVPGLQSKIETKKLEMHMYNPSSFLLLSLPVHPSALIHCQEQSFCQIKSPLKISGRFHLCMLRSVRNLPPNKSETVFRRTRAMSTFVLQQQPSGSRNTSCLFLVFGSYSISRNTSCRVPYRPSATP